MEVKRSFPCSQDPANYTYPKPDESISRSPILLLWNPFWCCPIYASFPSGGAVGWNTRLQTVRSRVRFPMVSLGFFIDIIFPALGSTQPLTEMSTRNISWVLRWLTRRADNLPPSCADCLDIWKPQPSGTLWACPGLYGDFLPLPLPLPVFGSFQNFLLFLMLTLQPRTGNLTKKRGQKWQYIDSL